MIRRTLWRWLLCPIDWHDWYDVQFFHRGWHECDACGKTEGHS